MVHPESASTISILLDRFCDFLQKQEKKATTIANYRYDVQAFLRDQDVPKQSLHALCIAAADRALPFRQKLIRACSTATFNRKMASLNSFFGFAAHSGWIRQEEIPRLPQVAPKPRKNKDIRFTSKRNKTCFFETQSRNREATAYALMSLMLSTGVRAS